MFGSVQIVSSDDNGKELSRLIVADNSEQKPPEAAIGTAKVVSRDASGNIVSETTAQGFAVGNLASPSADRPRIFATLELLNGDTIFEAEIENFIAGPDDLKRLQRAKKAKIIIETYDDNDEIVYHGETKKIAFEQS